MSDAKQDFEQLGRSVTGIARTSGQMALSRQARKNAEKKKFLLDQAIEKRKQAMGAAYTPPSYSEAKKMIKDEKKSQRQAKTLSRQEKKNSVKDFGKSLVDIRKGKSGFEVQIVMDGKNFEKAETYLRGNVSNVSRHPSSGKVRFTVSLEDVAELSKQTGMNLEKGVVGVRGSRTLEKQPLMYQFDTLSEASKTAKMFEGVNYSFQKQPNGKYCISISLENCKKACDNMAFKEQMQKNPQKFKEMLSVEKMLDKGKSIVDKSMKMLDRGIDAMVPSRSHSRTHKTDIDLNI